MKSSIIIIIVVIATAIISALCFSKFERQGNEMNLLEKSIADVKKIVPEGNAVSIQLVGAKMEYAIFTRYFLAPRRVHYPEIKSDTILIINSNGCKDSVMTNVVKSKRILWQHTDSANTYTLIQDR